MEEEENTNQNISEDAEPTEIEEKSDEKDQQNLENIEIEEDESHAIQNEDSTEKAIDEKTINKEATDDNTDGEHEDLKKDSKDTSEKQMEFDIGEADQAKTEEKLEEQVIALRDMDEIIEDEELSEEEEVDRKDQGINIEEEIENKVKETMSATPSVFTRGRGSIYYEMGPRFVDEEKDIISGDFLITDDDIPLKFYKYMDDRDEEECQEESVSEEEEVTIDRTPYYEKNESLTKDISIEKLRNNILHKKLAKFYKRRKMDHVLKETDQQFDTQEKYGKKLDAYGELTKMDSFQRTATTNELDGLKVDRESKLHKLNKMFEDLQIQEQDTGYGLIHTKTGKTIPDKLVERLVHRQKTQMQTVGDMRLKYIQLKNIVAEKQNAISQLDKIGENLYLMDYEQLKVENRGYMDKMEERDEELSRLRIKCQKTIQILAHMREKSAALDNDVYDLNDDLAALNFNSMGVRGELNQLKQQRDHYRNMTNKLRDESGLLMESELLRDMEVSIEDLKLATEELESLKKEHKIKAQQIRNIRKNIEYPPEGLIRRTHKAVSDKASGGRHLYKGRPSLHKPILPEDAFKHLRNFKGKPAFEKPVRKWRRP